MTIQQLIVCYADIDRFQVSTRHMGLEELVEFLQGYYERVGEALLAHNGRLVKYIGDAVLVSFERGQEEVAVRAMWALRQAYRDYADLVSPELSVSSLNAGIATGLVSVGQIGHPQMLAYDVVGKPVTIAAILARLGGVTMDRATHQALGEHVAVEPADTVGLVQAFRVTGFR